MALEKEKALLKEKELRITRQRLEILRLVRNSKRHLDAEEIFLKLRRKNKQVSKATVYRFLDRLEKEGLVFKLDFRDGRARYESAVEATHHDHLICIACGAVTEFHDAKIEKLQREIAAAHGFTLVEHIHQLYGLCPDCQNS